MKRTDDGYQWLRMFEYGMRMRMRIQENSYDGEMIVVV